jgi:hypothetical protein
VNGHLLFLVEVDVLSDLLFDSLMIQGSRDDEDPALFMGI